MQGRGWDGLRFHGVSAGAELSGNEGSGLRSKNTSPWDCLGCPWGLQRPWRCCGCRMSRRLCWALSGALAAPQPCSTWLWVHPVRAVSWVQRGQTCAGVQGFILSSLGAPCLWQPTLALSKSPSLSRIQRVQGELRRGLCPPSVNGLSQLGPALPCLNPPLAPGLASITPGLVWSLQGLAVTTGLTQSWNPAGIARAGGVRKWGLCCPGGLEGTKSTREAVLGQQLC